MNKVNEINKVNTLTDYETDTMQTMQRLANTANMALNGEGNNTKYGFMILAFNFNDDNSTANYISNGSRDDMIKVLREKANSLEQNKVIEGSTIISPNTTKQ